MASPAGAAWAVPAGGSSSWKIEREFAAQALGRDVGRDLGDDADRDRLILQIDRQRELLRHVIRVQLERALGRAQRAVVVAEVREREAEVVVGARVLRVGLDGPDEGVPGVGEALQLDEHEPHPVPRRRGARLLRQHLAIRFERELEAAQMGQEQREVEAGADERRRQLQRFPKSLDRIFGIGLMRQHDADVVPRERVAGIDLRRLAVGRQRVRRSARLMQHDAALVPELGRVGDLMDQRLVQLERIGEVALEEMHFRHRLAHQPAILAALDREAVLAQRLGVVALLPEREAEVVMRELAALDDLGRGMLAQAVLGRLAFGAVALQRQVGLRARQRRVQLDGALRRGARVLMPPHVAQHERHQVMGVGVVGIERNRALQRGERRLVQAAIVVDLAEIEVDDGRIGVFLDRPQKPFGRDFQPAARFLGEPELNDRRHVRRLVREQRFEFGDGFFVRPENRVRAAQLPARLTLVGRLAQPLLELVDAPVVVAGVVIRDFEIALGDLHARVELQRPRELLDGLGDEALLVIQDAEVVVRPGVRRIDPAGERAKNGEIAL